jgi:hypothetical protein
LAFLDSFTGKPKQKSLLISVILQNFPISEMPILCVLSKKLPEYSFLVSMSRKAVKQKLFF